MKKLLAMLMALMMLHLPMTSLAENFDDLDEMIGSADLETSIGVIGGADGPTSMFVTIGDANGLGDAALAAGRRINTVLSIKEIKGAETGDPTVDAAVNDLLKALGIAVHRQGEEGGLALQISGQDVLTLSGAVSGEDFYLNSNLLGGTVVVRAADIEPLIGKFLDMFVLMEAITASDAEEIKEIMAEAFDEMEASMGASMDSTLNALQELENVNFSALEKALTIILDNMEYVEASALPKLCEAAEGGIELRISNDEFVAILRACMDFVNDNPILKEYLAATGDFYTEEEVQEMWEFYKDSRLYKDEAAFRARHQTFEDVFNEAYASLNEAKLLDGDLTIGLYMNEVGVPVYGVMNLPMYDGYETSTLEIVYTRQTVAAGVAHVCNITVDGETVTIDALATEANTVINLIASNGMKTLDIIITNVGEDKLQAELNAYEGSRYKETNEKLVSVLLEGEWENTDVRSYLSGKLTMTNFDGVPTGETTVFTLEKDYVINGVDYSGTTEFGFEFEGVGMTIQVASETADAEASIVSGNATRLVELDDAAFQTWFVNLVNNLSVTLATALTALPESVLMLVLSSGMI